MEGEGEEVLDVEQLLSLLVTLVVVVLLKDLLSLVTNYPNQCVELVFFLLNCEKIKKYLKIKVC